MLDLGNPNREDAIQKPSHKPASKRARREDFGPPKLLKDEDLEAICVGFGIGEGQQAFFKSGIKKIILAIAVRINEDRSTSSRSADLDRLKSINSQLKDIIQKVDEMGPRGGLALRAISDSIGPMLSAGWISHQFPGDDLAPTKSLVSDDMMAGRLRPHMRERLRGPEYFIDELSLETRYQFARFRPKKTLIAILQREEQGIEAALSVIKSGPEARGGAPLTYRRYMLANLAKLWRSIGKQTPTSPQSEFAQFCEYVCECVGWPKRGVGSAIPKALELLAAFGET
jgi:hypothetical protein